MKLKAQVTLDLPQATDSQRVSFYEVLEAEKWSKMDGVSTTWKMSFKEGISFETAVSIIKTDLEAASKKSGASYIASISIGFAPIKVSGKPNYRALTI